MVEHAGKMICSENLHILQLLKKNSNEKALTEKLNYFKTDRQTDK